MFKTLEKNDPVFVERLRYFLEKEINEIDLSQEVRSLAILSVLMGTQSLELYKVQLANFLNSSLTPIKVKELVYQAVDYLGLGKVYPFLIATNDVMKEKGIVLPCQDQSTTTIDTRLEKGINTQAEIFGEPMKEAWKKSKVNYFLASNCFGDYYTRNGLSLDKRELITFCFLIAQGGCEPQVMAHVRGNLNLGNDKVFLTNVVLNCLPYIGYPRSLNALKCIEECK